MRTITINIDKLEDPLLTGMSNDARLIYFLLYALAGMCNANGRLVLSGTPLNTHQIAHKIHVDRDVLEKSISELVDSNKVIVNKNKQITMTEFVHEQIDINKKRTLDRLRQQRHRKSIKHDGEAVTA